jgi:hypothetical protein
MSSDLQADEVIAWLRERSDKEFVDVFYRAAAGRTLAPLTNPDLDSHLVLTHASKNSEAPGDWELEFVGLPANPSEWTSETLLTQQGEHCFQSVISYAREFACPLCGGETIAR